MKKLFMLALIAIALSSCNATKYVVTEPNTDFTDTGITDSRIDTTSIVGTYPNLDRDVLLFKKPVAYKQQDSVAGGVVYRRDILSGEQLVVPSRFFVRDKKGKKVFKENDVALTAPFLNEVVGYELDSLGSSMYSKVFVKIDGGNDVSGDTFVFIPDNQIWQGPIQSPQNQQNSNSHVLSLRKKTQLHTQSNFIRDDNTHYRLSLSTCEDNCDEQKDVNDAGFLVEPGTRKIYFIYEGYTYYVTESYSGQEWFVLAETSEVGLFRFYLKPREKDTRKTDYAKSKRIGQ